MAQSNKLASTRRGIALSLPQYITFDIETAVGNAPQSPPTGWNWQKLDSEQLLTFLDYRFIAEFGAVGSHDITPEAVDAYLAAACDWSMPRKSYHGAKKPVHWWIQGIANLHKSAFAAGKGPEDAKT